MTEQCNTLFKIHVLDADHPWVLQHPEPEKMVGFNVQATTEENKVFTQKILISKEALPYLELLQHFQMRIDHNRDILEKVSGPEDGEWIKADKEGV